MKDYTCRVCDEMPTGADVDYCARCEDWEYREMMEGEVERGARSFAFTVTPTQSCDPKCPGWGVFSTGRGVSELQKCDICGTYRSDMQAAAAALNAIAEKDDLLYDKADVVQAILNDLNYLITDLVELS